MRPLQWQPVTLNGSQVSGQPGLLETLITCGMMVQHAASPVPLLVDVNLHYRLLK